jgi:serine/threonine protein kinase
MLWSKTMSRSAAHSSHKACADDTAVRREAEAMLTFSPDRLEHEAESMARALRREEPSRADERIGSYRVVRELGRGGMGTVWLASRADRQFEKQVAIKLLKRGTDTDEVLRRFQSERQILAQLEHPNIARLLDAGTTEGDLPFFVMEFVEGERLTDFVWARALPLNERLHLFGKICAAVQFAHQNLVVHRDLEAEQHPRHGRRRTEAARLRYREAARRGG